MKQPDPIVAPIGGSVTWSNGWECPQHPSWSIGRRVCVLRPRTETRTISLSPALLLLSHVGPLLCKHTRWRTALSPPRSACVRVGGGGGEKRRRGGGVCCARVEVFPLGRTLMSAELPAPSATSLFQNSELHRVRLPEPWQPWLGTWFGWFPKSCCPLDTGTVEVEQPSDGRGPFARATAAMARNLVFKT